MLFYSNRKAHPFSISDVPIYKSIFHLLQAPPVTVYKPLFFNVSSTILMTAHIYKAIWDFTVYKKQFDNQSKYQGLVFVIKIFLGYERVTLHNIQRIKYNHNTIYSILETDNTQHTHIKHQHHPCCNINKYTVPRFGDAQKKGFSKWRNLYSKTNSYR